MQKIIPWLWKALSISFLIFWALPAWGFLCPRSVAYYHFLVGETLLNKGDLERGAEELEKTLNCDPEALFPRRELVKVYAQLGKYQRAINLAQEVLRVDPKDSKIRFILAKLYLAQGRKARAIETLETLLEKDPDNLEALQVLAMIYMQEKRLDQAIDKIKSLLKKRPKVASLWLELARLYREKGDFSKAQKAYAKALELAPDELQWVLEYGNFLQKLGENKEAEKVYQKALKNFPHNYHLEQSLYQLYLQQHRYQEALKLLDALEQHLGPQVQLDLRRALILLDLNQPTKAQAILQDILKRDPQNDMARFYLGVALEQTGRLAEAVRQYQAISPKAKIFPLALRRLAHLEKDVSHLRRLLKKALAKDPHNKDLYILAGNIFEDLDRCDLGYQFVEKGLKLFPKDPNLKISAAFLLTCLGKSQEALKLIEPILQKQPDNPTILNFVGYTYAELGIKLDKAEQLIKKALKYRPNDGYILDSLAWVYYRKGQYQEALKIIEQALKQVSDDPIIYEHKGDILKALGRDKEALRAYRKALTYGPKRLLKKRLKEKIKNLCAKLSCSS